jgi:monooxygenase
MQVWLYQRCRTAPGETAAWFTTELQKALGQAYDAEAFTPPYNPWEQRLCLVPDGDFFDAVKQGKASMVTATIAKVDKAGVRLADGRHLAADILVPATGLKLSMLGKIAVSLDGQPVDFPQHYYYRSCMFSNLPNMAALFGYLNAGWTLRVDLVADWLCRLINQMDAWDRHVVTPYLASDHALVEDNPIDKFSSGYLHRLRALSPKSTAHAPWRIGMNYLEDRAEMRGTPIDDGVLKFERVGVGAVAH